MTSYQHTHQSAVYSDNTIKRETNEATVYTALSSLVNKVDFGSTLFNVLCPPPCRFSIVCLKLGGDE